MSKPTVRPEWASNANYSAGPDIGIATKLAPTSGEKAEGYYRGYKPPARKLNWVLDNLAEWIDYLEESEEGLLAKNYLSSAALDIATGGAIVRYPGAADVEEQILIMEGTSTNGYALALSGRNDLDVGTYGGTVYNTFKAGAWNDTICLLGGVRTVASDYKILRYERGVGWTGEALGASDTNPITGLHWWDEKSLWLAGQNGGKIFSSTDGSSWTQRSAVGGGATQTWFASNSSICIAISGAAGSQNYYTSPDGVTWTLRATLPAPGGGSGWKGAVWVPDLATFMTGAYQYSAASADGLTWTQTAIGTTQTIHALACDGRRLVAGLGWDTNGAIMSTNDAGQLWELNHQILTTSFSHVCSAFVSGRFVFVHGHTNPGDDHIHAGLSTRRRE